MDTERKRNQGNMGDVILSVEDIIKKLVEVEGLKFGQFTMRTGEITPVYIDMRVIWSYPDIVVSVGESMWREIRRRDLQFDAVVGLPYQGIPLATYISTKYNIPMLLKRQQPKTYGTCKLLEGHYKKGDRVLLVDDVIMTGGTLVKDIPAIENEGLEVIGSIAFFDRDQGGAERSKVTNGKTVISIQTLPDALQLLLREGKISQATVDAAMEYLRTNRFDTPEYGVTEGKTE